MVRDGKRFEGLGSAAGRKGLEEKGPWYYEMQELGYNYRITDLQCALGLSQLRQLEDFVVRRREIVARYNEAFSSVPFLATPDLAAAASRDLPSWHLYTLQIDFESIERTRTEVMAGLRELGIGTQVLYIPVHLQPYYRKHHGYAAGKCPVAEQFYERCLSIPLYPALTDDDVDRVIAAIRSLG
jgi:dTDP-4-amino-4,6-dideoxygalactose transaminase